MRVIKYRFWDVVGDKGIMRSWGSVQDLTVDRLFVPFPGIEVMQFTGLLDKNGTEIYEGDIVEFRANYTTIERCGWQKAEVAWDDEYARFELRVATHDEPFDIAEHTDEFRHKAEVIGNIHENPELLP